MGVLPYAGKSSVAHNPSLRPVIDTSSPAVCCVTAKKWEWRPSSHNQAATKHKGLQSRAVDSASASAAAGDRVSREEGRAITEVAQLQWADDYRAVGRRRQTHRKDSASTRPGPERHYRGILGGPLRSPWPGFVTRKSLDRSRPQRGHRNQDRGSHSSPEHGGRTRRACVAS